MYIEKQIWHDFTKQDSHRVNFYRECFYSQVLGNVTLVEYYSRITKGNLYLPWVSNYFP
eukprot:UN08599